MSFLMALRAWCNFRKVAPYCLRTVRRVVEESFLRRPIPSTFARYLASLFPPEIVGQVRHAIKLTRAFGGKFISAEQLRTISPLSLAVVLLKNAAQRPIRPGPIEVSIVVPVHNNVAYTLMCLTSIFRHRTRRPFEVIVGDDASTDATQSLIGSLGAPIVYLRHPRNLGYLQNCNASAALARGRYFVLLNNDTLILPGAIDELIDLMTANPNIGLAGSKLLFDNGRLQEAGGIVWKDASTSNFGRDSNPQLPPFNYVKDVDCCAAASVAVRTSLWHTLGGFDERYLPAYFEDTDLAFRIRAAGLRTVYQPKSVVIHYEAATHGRDESYGARRYLVENRKVFHARWHEALAREQCESGKDLFLARDRSRCHPHILVIDRDVPAMDGDPDSRALFEVISTCARNAMQLSLWPETWNRESRSAVDVLQQRGVEVLASQGYDRNLRGWIAENGRYLDYVLLGRPGGSPWPLERIVALTRARVLRYGNDLGELRQAGRGS